MIKKIIAIALITATCNLVAQQKSTKKTGNSIPLKDGAKASLNYEYALNDPLKARIYTLKNGLKVYLSVYKDAPRIQTYIAIKAGSKNDPSTATGLAHYLEHMVFKGTDKYGTKDFKKEAVEIKKIENLYEVYRKTKDEAQRKKIYHQIDSISGVAAKYAIANEYDKMTAAIGADGTNAFTSFDETVYVNDIPSNQVSNWLKLEAERFKAAPVLRLFHTELEAVYEEKNRGLDSDDNLVYETLWENLFKNHTYGTQTTIGTIDHLKNPSMVEINKYYNKYYVPNNMAIIMSGDFDPDKVIVDIEKTFGNLKFKPVEKYTYSPEPSSTGVIRKTIYGPDPAGLGMVWRISGFGTKEYELGMLLSIMMFNNTAGLLDINLNQSQKVLNSACSNYGMKDYSVFGFDAKPKDGQELEEVEKLLLEQLDLIRKGNFPEWLMTGAITELKYQNTVGLENNGSRAGQMLGAFTKDIKWQKQIDMLERISKITKQELIDFATNVLRNDNYVIAYKKVGPSQNTQKVEKPQITPVELDRENTSPFAQAIMTASASAIEPKFLDFDKDLTKTTIKSNIPLIYVENKENKLFRMYYKFNMGKNNDKILPIAVKYFKYLATEDQSAAEIKQELFKLGSSVDVFTDNESTWLSVDGLADNFYKTIQLFEKMFLKPLVDKTVLDNVINDIIKERNDLKLQKDALLYSGLRSYALYGPVNPFSNNLSDEALKKITVDDIKYKIKLLLTFEHEVLYYGTQTLDDVKFTLNTYHNVPANLTKVPEPMKFEIKTLQNEVYAAEFDMKQAEMVFLSNGTTYNPLNVPVITLYNSYFGGNMSGVVFQDLRESKALAYSCFSRYSLPDKLEKKSYNMSYIGSQADKLEEAMKGMTDLLTTLPKADASFNSAKESVIAESNTQRITKGDIIFSYLSARNLGLNYDIRKEVYEKVKNLTFDDVKKFQEENIKGKPKTVIVIGKKENLNNDVLQKYGPVKYLTLKELYGY